MSWKLTWRWRHWTGMIFFSFFCRWNCQRRRWRTTRAARRTRRRRRSTRRRRPTPWTWRRRRWRWRRRRSTISRRRRRRIWRSWNSLPRRSNSGASSWASRRATSAWPWANSTAMISRRRRYRGSRRSTCRSRTCASWNRSCKSGWRMLTAPWAAEGPGPEPCSLRAAAAAVAAAAVSVSVESAARCRRRWARPAVTTTAWAGVGRRGRRLRRASASPWRRLFWPIRNPRRRRSSSSPTDWPWRRKSSASGSATGEHFPLLHRSSHPVAIYRPLVGYFECLNRLLWWRWVMQWLGKPNGRHPRRGGSTLERKRKKLSVFVFFFRFGVVEHEHGIWRLIPCYICFNNLEHDSW